MNRVVMGACVSMAVTVLVGWSLGADAAHEDPPVPVDPVLVGGDCHLRIAEQDHITGISYSTYEDGLLASCRNVDVSHQWGFAGQFDHCVIIGTSDTDGADLDIRCWND